MFKSKEYFIDTAGIGHNSNFLPKIWSRPRLAVLRANYTQNIAPPFNSPRGQINLPAPSAKIKQPSQEKVVLFLWRWGELNPRPGFGPKNFYLGS